MGDPAVRRRVSLLASELDGKRLRVLIELLRPALFAHAAEATE